MIEQIGDDLQQIVSLFHLTQPLTIPRGQNDWATVEGINLSEVAALSLALGFFLRRVGNRAQRLQQAKIDLLSIKQ